MPSPLTQTEVVNAAAALLGSTERITSIDGAGNLASHARASWDITIRAMLEDHPWNFAIARAALNASPAPEFGYDRAFALPADCLRLLPSRGDDWNEDQWQGEVEGGYIVSDDEAPLHVRYVSSAYITDCSRWTSLFGKAASYHLAEAMCEGLTGSQGLDSTIVRKGEYWLARAKRHDALQSPRGTRGGISHRSNWLQGQRQPYNRYWR